MLENLSGSLLSEVIYNGFKKGVSITKDFLKENLQGWLLNDEILIKLANKVNELNLEDYGERVIAKKLTESSDIEEILKQIKPVQNTEIGSVIQTHSGTGDNVLGNKITYNK